MPRWIAWREAGGKRTSFFRSWGNGTGETGTMYFYFGQRALWSLSQLTKGGVAVGAGVLPDARPHCQGIGPGASRLVRGKKEEERAVR